jgi:SPP1 family predicted phage head-tail adaptor
MSLQHQYMPRKAVGINDPGALDRLVTLQSPTASPDTAGGPAITWATVATVWATKSALTGTRLLVAAMTSYEADVVFRIRWRSDVIAGWRVVHGSSTYEIKIVEELGRHHLQDLTCRAINQPTGG